VGTPGHFEFAVQAGLLNFTAVLEEKKEGGVGRREGNCSHQPRGTTKKKIDPVEEIVKKRGGLRLLAKTRLGSGFWGMGDGTI